MYSNDWKDRLSLVYSTNPDIKINQANEELRPTLPNAKQNLRVKLDKKNRGGKAVTLVTGYIGGEESLKELGKKLKNRCGVGGSVKEGEILIQGSFVERVIQILTEDGFRVKKSGG